MLRLLAYLPDQTEPIEARLVRFSESADLAILAVEPSRFQDLGIPLADAASRVGEELYLLGYPTGLKALIAQAGQGFFEELEAEGTLNFWWIASRLSSQSKIHPLASRGIGDGAREDVCLVEVFTNAVRQKRQSSYRSAQNE